MTESVAIDKLLIIVIIAHEHIIHDKDVANAVNSVSIELIPSEYWMGRHSRVK